MDRWHNEHIGRFRQATEGIRLHGVFIEGDNGGHITVIFKIEFSCVENLHRFAHFVGALSHGLAESGVRQQGQARFIAEAPCDPGGLLSDVGQFLWGRHFCDIGVRDEQSPTTRQMIDMPITRSSGIGSMTFLTSSKTLE